MDERTRLMAWKPGAPGYSKDDTMLAVGLQCRAKHFPLKDVIEWLGTPDKVIGDAAEGEIVYFYVGPKVRNPEDEAVYMFNVVNGEVVDFGTITRFKPNAIKPDGVTYFNILDDMVDFAASDFA